MNVPLLLCYKRRSEIEVLKVGAFLSKAKHVTPVNAMCLQEIVFVVKVGDWPIKTTILLSSHA